MVGKMKIYVASLSGGKDSVAMVLRLIKEKKPLDYVVFYDTGMEFKAVYEVIRQMQEIVESNGIKFVYLQSDTNFLVDMLIKPVKERDTGNIHYGYDWCGGCTRWRTSKKVECINRFYKSLDGEIVQYVGFAADEQDRFKEEENTLYPLAEWGMTEADALEYCFNQGIHWIENGIELYSILKRVSCWCCKNKNLEELKNIWWYLPYYWELLKGLQSRIDRPFHDQMTIFDLEKRFIAEGHQIGFLDLQMGANQ